MPFKDAERRRAYERERARKRRAGVIRDVQGGNGKISSAPTRALPPAPQVADVTALLSGEINRLLQADADLMVRARAVGFLCNVILKSLEVGAVEERLAAVEARISGEEQA